MTLVQMPCVEGERQKNFDKASALLGKTPNRGHTEFVLLPELFAIGFRHEDYPKVGAGIPGETSTFLEELAEKRGAYVLASGIEAAGSKFYNTLIVASPSGKTIAKYSKIHPFQEEKDVFRGGEEIVLLKVAGIKVGLAVCYDVRFPEITRKLAMEGAEIIFIPAAFPDPRSAHWDTLVMARAIENQLYVAATNRVGNAFDGKTYFGHSQVVDPWGVRLTRINSEEQVFTATGNTDSIKSVREQITCYLDRAPTAYDGLRWFKE